MNKLTAIFTLAAMALCLVPQARAADLYANELVSSSLFDLLSPSNALGEPDEQYADFRDQNTFLKLDMGSGEEGRDGLTLFVQVLEYGSTAVVTFYSADNVALGTDNVLFDPGATEWTATYTGTESFRYVKIESPNTKTWRLDAVQATAIDTPIVDDDVIEDPQTGDDEAEELTVAANTLIKSASSDAVYVIGADGKRHPFPNETTFYSWGYSFDNVVEVDDATLASFVIGGSVTIKPGTYLVKIQSVPKVYVVAPNHTLRWLYSEDIAAEIYGDTWANEVIDVSDAFWPDYLQGEIINSVDDIQGWEVETRPF